ncbi:Methylmalonyl-CoA mutase, large subunit [Desulfatibacillum aliphaticivorans]|uniref:Methylmalonyl-CoA mutase, large subunit n=1 Tax=Desulfatibacillum aliphaticivorans TaxID=218208 RepID=B8FMY4_DESAL|nr:acyl-CoA mutase large subunit family protein [Desulfatibacillum aliphaticivorans]ACL05854.1 Methylmalonyl-CoA mutase, large subunit [Desulfatibacillum aliphaticivorans]
MKKDTVQLDRHAGGLVRWATQGHIEVKEFYTPEDTADRSYEESLGDPGQYPYTRGLYQSMYRDRLWLKSFIVGYATVEETNEAFKKYIAAGMNDLRIGGDLNAQVGLDPDHPSAFNSISCAGPTVPGLYRFEKILEGIDLEQGVYELGDASPSSCLFRYSMLLALMENQEKDISRIRGNAVNDPIRSKLVFGIRDFTTEINKRICLDFIEFSKKHTPKWHPFSPNGVDLNQSGMDAVAEVGGVLALGEAVCRELQNSRGISVDEFGPMVFSMDADSDFFETIAKFRVARRMWARIAKEKLGAQTERAMKLKIGIRTSGLSLQEQNPLNNAARITLQILNCVFGGVNSLDSSCMDEALGLPSFEARMFSLNAQHIVTHEANIPMVADPLGGSYYLEWLTNKIESDVTAYMAEMEANGGIFECMENDWLKGKMLENRRKVQKERQDGKRLIVGVDAFKHPEGPINQAIIDSAYHAPPLDVRMKVLAELKEFRESRDPEKLKSGLMGVYLASKHGENVVRPIIDAIKAGMTLGEMVGVIRLGYSLPYDNLNQIDTPEYVKVMLKEAN